MRQTCRLSSIIAGFTFAAVVGSHALLFGQTARLVVQAPASGLIGDPLTIEASGLAPGEPYSLNLTLEDYWGGRARARAVFLADAKGTIDITRDAPVVGNYSGVDPLG